MLNLNAEKPMSFFRLTAASIFIGSVGFGSLYSQIDATPPAINCPEDIIVLSDPGLGGSTVSYTPPVGTDNLPGAITFLLSGRGQQTTIGVEQAISTAALGAYSVFATDLDGDSDLDILSASFFDHKIAWYENLGGSSFGTQQIISTAAQNAVCVYAADLDGDGDSDVLSASFQDDKIAWYENIGAGSFGAQQVISTIVDGAYNVYVKDLDGDGDADVLSASAQDDKIAWYENLGGGIFGVQKVISTAANGASGVYAADLDGDGDADVLSASNADDKIAWYENIGDGSFGPQQVISIASNFAVSVYAADLDGDGDKDVLCASTLDDKIAWFENLGSGSFGPEQVISTDADGVSIVYAADLDGDGDADVLCANTFGDKVEWYENTGGGSFSLPQVVNADAGTPYCVFAADLDGDGDLDVLSANLSDDKIAWYENIKSGSFFPLGTNTETYLVTDEASLTDTCSFTITVLPDTIPEINCPTDMVVGVDTGSNGAIVMYTPPVGIDDLPGAVTTLLSGNGTGGFFPIGIHSETYLVTDVSGNTDTCSFTISVVDDIAPMITCPEDIVIFLDSALIGLVVAYLPPIGTDNLPGVVTTLLSGLGSGSVFPVGTTTETYLVSDVSGNTNTCSFTIAVMDNVPPSIICPEDIVLASDSASSGAVVTYTVPLGVDNQPGAVTTLLSGIGQQTVFGNQQVISTSANQAVSIYTADLDDDGDADVLSASQNDNKIAWYENTGGGSFGSEHVISIAAESATCVFAIDLDGDGDTDVLSTSESDNKIAWYENMGGGNFGPQQVINSTANGAGCVYATDLDGDGDADLIVESGIIAWYENLGNGSFGPESLISDVSASARGIYAADLDGDGDVDVVSAFPSANKIAWYENLGGGSFGSQQVISTDAVNAWSVYAADLDGDGDTDVLSANASFSSSKIAWYENLGSGIFGPQQVISTATNYAITVYAKDLDGDGDEDVLSTSFYDKKIAWYENLDNGSFGPQQVISNADNGAWSVYAADLDDDGDADVLSTSFANDKIAWYENVKSGKFFPEGTNTETYLVTDAVGLTDTCSFTITVQEMPTCTTALPPQNPRHTLLASAAKLTWDPVAESVACQVQGTRISPPGPTGTRNILGFEPFSTNVPYAVFGAGTTWRWRTRCACSTSPVQATAYSVYDTITVPASNRETQPEQFISLFPNPASDVLFIELEGFSGETLDVLVTAMDGRTMLSRRESIGFNWQTLELDVTSFASGLYAVTVTSSNMSQVSRFFKGE